MIRCHLADPVLGLQQDQHRHDHHRGSRHPDHLHDLLLPRRGSHDVTRLEVLQVVPAHRRRATHDRADQERCRRPGRMVAPHHRHQHQGRQPDRCDRHPRHGIARAAHESRHVGGHGGKEKRRAGHEHRHHQGNDAVPHDRVVNERHRHQHQPERHQHPEHRRVIVSSGDAVPVPTPAGRGVAIGSDRPPHPFHQRSAKLDKGPEPADEHCADADVPDAGAADGLGRFDRRHIFRGACPRSVQW